MKADDDKKSLDQRIDEHNNGRLASSEKDREGEGLAVDQRPSETHNAVSHPNGDGWSENRVSTSLDED